MSTLPRFLLCGLDFTTSAPHSAVLWLSCPCGFQHGRASQGCFATSDLFRTFSWRCSLNPARCSTAACWIGWILFWCFGFSLLACDLTIRHQLCALALLGPCPAVTSLDWKRPEAAGGNHGHRALYAQPLDVCWPALYSCPLQSHAEFPTGPNRKPCVHCLPEGRILVSTW